jgi:hypothetical protein
VASAWLIRRFIDPQATFVWLKRPKDCPTRAVGFDFDGAEFSHENSKVTFEVLVSSFDLETIAVINARIGIMEILPLMGRGEIIIDLRVIATARPSKELRFVPASSLPSTRTMIATHKLVECASCVARGTTRGSSACACWSSKTNLASLKS